MNCFAPGQGSRVKCPCGGRNSLRVVVEYVLPGHGRVDYAGGRFCYVSDALIDIEIPDDAIPIRAMVYDLHEPDEIIRITFRRRMSPGAGADAPGEAGDDREGYLP